MTYLAIDFGGGSGRVIAGTLSNGKLKMEVIHRFGNRQVKLGKHTYWDFPALFDDMITGLKMAGQQGLEVAGIGIDTWGVDFGLIDRNGNLIGNPVCYRDERTLGMPERAFQTLNATLHYAETGTQVMPINTLFQLLSLKTANDPQLEIADKLLFMPDLFSYFLTGEANCEYTIASTSELLDASTRNWSWKTIEALGLPPHIFPKIIMPGTIRGRLSPQIAQLTGLGEVDVIAVGSHDTASAVAAVPASAEESPVAFLSSGTWSLLGVEIPKPILSEEARKAEFTNEGGVGGRITFLQNITGLWIVQRLMAEWEERGEKQQFEDILPQAEVVNTACVFPVDDPAFQNPASMEQAILVYCQTHGIKIPTSKAEIMRAVLQSLAAKYAEATRNLNKLLPQPIKKLHIIGGGSQNVLLNNLTSKALDIPVSAGPIEATGIGNLLTQALAKGEISDLTEIRSIVRNSIKDL